MGSTKDSFGIMSCERSTEEDEENRQGWSSQRECQSEREESGLDGGSVFRAWVRD